MLKEHVANKKHRLAVEFLISAVEWLIYERLPELNLDTALKKDIENIRKRIAVVRKFEQGGDCM